MAARVMRRLELRRLPQLGIPGARPLRRSIAIPSPEGQASARIRIHRGISSMVPKHSATAAARLVTGIAVSSEATRWEGILLKWMFLQY